jgi:viroplasmin and RNaseH domain-containing protein
MEKYQKEVSDLQFKIHGQFNAIEFNEINEFFYSELAKECIEIDKFEESYQKLNDYYSKGYENNKEEIDNKFVKEVINDMKRMMEIASMIKDEN